MSSLDEVFVRLLHVSSPNVVTRSLIVDSFIMASQFQNTAKGEQGDHGGKRSRVKCSHYHQWGYSREKCYKLHGRPTRATNVVHANHSDLRFKSSKRHT